MADAHFLFIDLHVGVFRYLSRIVGQGEAARDLTQEVFLRVSRAPEPEGTGIERRAWVFKIARNLALNHVRDRLRRPEAMLFAEPARAATQEVALALQEALNKLAEVDRDVFLMRETAGLNYGEIALACDLTVDAVRARLHRARQQLRGTLSASIGEEQRRGVGLTSTK